MLTDVTQTLALDLLQPSVHTLHCVLLNLFVGGLPHTVGEIDVKNGCVLGSNRRLRNIQMFA